MDYEKYRVEASLLREAAQKIKDGFVFPNETLITLFEGAAVALDKTEEYQEVSALVCDDIDQLYEASADMRTKKELVEQIAMLHEDKTQYITSPEKRKSAYQARLMLFSLCAMDVKE